MPTKRTIRDRVRILFSRMSKGVSGLIENIRKPSASERYQAAKRESEIYGQGQNRRWEE